VTEELAEQIIQHVHDLLDAHQLQDDNVVRCAVMEDRNPSRTESITGRERWR
jgi:hypothetical protein